MVAIMLFIDYVDTELAIRTLLESVGYKVYIVTSSQECIKNVAKFKPDLLLLDALKPRDDIIRVVSKLPKVKMVYINSEDLDLRIEKLYGNIIGSVKSTFNNKEFLAKIKKMLKSNFAN
jgi:DNA-binding response OmpR family regulator